MLNIVTIYREIYLCLEKSIKLARLSAEERINIAWDIDYSDCLMPLMDLMFND